MKLRIYIIVALISVLFFFSCNSRTKKEEPKFYEITTIQQADSVRKLLAANPYDTTYAVPLWKFLSRTGKNEELVIMAKKSFYHYSEGGEINAAAISATYAAMAYTILDKADSANIFLEYAKENLKPYTPAYGLAYNSSAVHAMKFGMNYPQAMDYFKTALDYFRKANNIENQIITLGNIANLYADRKDTTGTRFIRESYRLAQENAASPYALCFSASSLAYSEYLRGEIDSAIYYNRIAEKLAIGDSSLKRFLPVIYSSYADIFLKLDNLEKAEHYIKLAFSSIYPNYPDKSVEAGINTTYGDLLSTRDTDAAINAYLKSIRISEENKIVIGLPELYYKVSEMYAQSYGKEDSAIAYFKKYHNSANEYYNRKKDNDFNNLMLKYEEIKHKSDIQEREIELSNSRKLTTLFFSAFIVISVVLYTTALMYRRKNTMYLRLVEQHQNMLKERESIKSALFFSQNPENKNDIESRYFTELERLMNEQKIYRDNDISLEKVSRMMNTNRTYLSSAINRFAGTSFPNYINKFRIEEAISILADPDSDVVIKNMCYNLGYNSLTSFYRTFQKETGCSPAIYRKKVLELNASRKNR